MSGWSLAVFVLLLGSLILVHELGHFLTAKLFGVRVLEFALGFPPRLFSFRRGETLYSFNLIPLGGFNRMLGEEDPSHPKSLAAKPPGPRLIILSAGSLAMFLFPFLLFPLAFMIPHSEVVGGEGIKVIQVVPNSPAYFADLKSGDEILAVDAEEVKDFDQLHEIINSKRGQEVTLLLRRDGGLKQVNLVPRESPPPGQGPMGITLSWANPIIERRAYPPWKAVVLGAKQTWRVWVMFKEGLAALIGGEARFTLAGPVGIAQATGEVARGGLMSLAAWTSFLSINLGVINLLPIPALDGGRIVFVLLEVLRGGKRIPVQRERLAHLIGLLVLVLLMVVVTYWDILRIFEGGSLFR